MRDVRRTVASLTNSDLATLVFQRPGRSVSGLDVLASDSCSTSGGTRIPTRRTPDEALDEAPDEARRALPRDSAARVDPAVRVEHP